MRGKRQIHGTEKAAKESQQSVSQIPHQTVVLLTLRTCWQARVRLEFCWDTFQWLKSSLLGLHKFLCLRNFDLSMFIDDSHSPEQKLSGLPTVNRCFHQRTVILVATIMLSQAVAFRLFDHNLHFTSWHTKTGIYRVSDLQDNTTWEVLWYFLFFLFYSI